MRWRRYEEPENYIYVPGVDEHVVTKALRELDERLQRAEARRAELTIRNNELEGMVASFQGAAEAHRPEVPYWGQLGEPHFGSHFVCEACVEAWPCTFVRTVDRVLSFGQHGELEPLELRRVQPDLGVGESTPG